MPTLVLLRHGQSQWNLENRFTGWVDVDLTAEGEAQAKKGGELIKAAGLEFDRAYTSVLTRAVRTLDLALDFLRKYFLVYSACNICIGAIFRWPRSPPAST